MLIPWQSSPKRVKTTRPFLHQSKRRFQLSESMLGLLAALWMGMVALIYYLLQCTLIPLLQASQLYFMFGLAGFILAFLVRHKLTLSLLDGLYINVFITGPLCILMFLAINRVACAPPFTESYEIVSFEPMSGGYLLELENNAYADFWRVRNVTYAREPSKMKRVKFKFSDGYFGYKVLIETQMNEL